jgi:hypothetical protein
VGNAMLLGLHWAIATYLLTNELNTLSHFDKKTEGLSKLIHGMCLKVFRGAGCKMTLLIRQTFSDRTFRL